MGSSVGMPVAVGEAGTFVGCETGIGVAVVGRVYDGLQAVKPRRRKRANMPAIKIPRLPVITP
jgi:hypothetical protein